ncbi:MAG: hypothetical protein ABL952_16500 [Pyrinomonadaceae bacterium]
MIKRKEIFIETRRTERITIRRFPEPERKTETRCPECGWFDASEHSVHDTDARTIQLLPEKENTF